MKFIIGKKLDMTQVWRGDEAMAVTRVQAGPCSVAQLKGKDKDGYEAVQIGYGVKKVKNINKSQQGHMRGLGNFRYLREFRAEAGALKRGDVITVGTFAAGDIIQATGISKGKGFQGVVRRHGFSGSKKTHGNKDQLRMPGSIGATGPAHVFKGTRMAGRMGGGQVTTKNLEIVGIEPADNILLVKGAVPGARNGLLLIAGEGVLIVESLKAESEKPKTESENAENAKTVKPATENEKTEVQPETPEKVEKEVIEAKVRVEAKKKSDK